MANNWWEAAPLAQTSQPQPQKEWWEAAPLAQPAPTQQPTESGGFTGSFGTALQERAATFMPAVKMFTGLGDQKAAADEMLRAKKASQDAYKQTEFSEIGDAFKTGDFSGALGKTVDKFKEVAGSSFGSMAPAAAAGVGANIAAGVALGTVGAVPAAIGTAAFGLVTLGSYIADNIGRQKEEQEKAGKKYEDINRLTATTAAAGSTALDLFAGKIFKPLGALVGMEGKEASQKVAREIVEAAKKPGAYARAVRNGAASGVAFEIPQEVTQQVLERWQAGLPLDPFSDPEAAKEYLEAAGGALLLGGPMGAYSGAKTTYDLRKPPKPTTWTQDLEEGKNVRQPITKTGGEGTGLAGESGAGAPAGGAGVSEPGGVVSTRSDAGVSTEGKGVPTPPVEGEESQLEKWKQRADEGREAGPLAGQETVATKYGDLNTGMPEGDEPAGLWADQQVGAQVTKPAAPAAPATPVAQPVGNLAQFRELYDQLRTELSDLLSITTVTPQISNQIALVQRDLNRLVDENKALINDNALAKQLKIPTFDGTKALENLEAGKPRAMQGNLFGTFTSAARRASGAMALAGQNVQDALARLRKSREDLQNQLDQDTFSDTTIMRIGRTQGLNGGESLQRRRSLGELYTNQALADVDAAIDILERQSKQPRAMQGDIFGKEQPKDVGTEAPESLTDVFGKPEKAPTKRATTPATSKGSVTTGPSISPQERVSIYTSERARVNKALQNAQAKLTALKNQVQPADPEVVKVATDSVNALTRNLESVERELAKAKADVEAGVVAPEIKTQKAGPEAGELFAAEDLRQPPPSTQREPQRFTRITEEQKDAAAQLEEDFGAPLPDEVFEGDDADVAARLSESPFNWRAPRPTAPTPQKPPTKAKEKIEAPDESTEHVAETREGEKLEEFFNLIESNSDSSQEVKKHQGLASSILNMLLEFDIVEPGKKTSPGMQKIYDDLTSLFGGRAKFNELITQLRTAGPEMQAALFKRAGVPDLTTYRGLTTFQKNLQDYLNELSSTGEGFKIPTRSQQRLVDGTTRVEETLPYTDDVNFLEYELREYPDRDGEPREPEIVNVDQQYKLKDFKLRSAWAHLKSVIQLGKKGGKGAPRKEQLAAYRYMTNPNYESFGQLINGLAMELAYWEEYLERKYGMPIAQLNKIPEDQWVVADVNAKPKIGENAVFHGGGGRYALNFRQWIRDNLSESTGRILDRLVKRHRENIEAEEKYDAAHKVYEDRQKQQATKREEERRQNNADKKAAAERRREAKKRAVEALEAAERAGANVPKAPEHEDIDVSEETDEVLTPELDAPFKNQPILQVLLEVDPNATENAINQLKAGNLKAVLKLMSSTAAAKINKYYAALAQRILDANITAKSRVIDSQTMESLSNDPKVQETLDNYIDVLEQAVLASVPKDQQAGILSDLKSKKLEYVGQTVTMLQDTLPNPAHKQIASDTLKLINNEYNWEGKYDPESDTIVFRRGRITNGLVLHESLHAALSSLLDNHKNLQGARLEAYKQLENLYNYAKQILNQQGFTEQDKVTYGLTDIHEFVSEALSNPNFQAMLRRLRFKASPFSMLTSFVQAVKKLFGVKDGAYTNVLFETIKAVDVLMPGGISGVDTMQVKGQPRASMATSRVIKKVKTPSFREGRPNSPSAIRELMKSTSWSNARVVYENMRGVMKPAFLGALTLRQISDLVNNRIPQVRQFIDVVENYMSRKNAILRESGEISKRWERLQNKNPELSRLIGRVMHRATMVEVDPDKATLEQRNAQPELMADWAELKKNVNAVNIYRDVRDFYAKRYEEYQEMMLDRLDLLQSKGVSENTIAMLRKKFETESPKGPYFPLIRYGRYWYQVGKGSTRQYYMFEKLGDRNKHMQQMLKDHPEYGGKAEYGDSYLGMRDDQSPYLQKTNFLTGVMDAIDGLKTGDKKELKDSVYQAYLSNMPERSFRKQFIHRQNIAGYSEDALRNFSSSSFQMAYQLSRFQYSPEMFARVESARLQLKERRKEAGADPEMVKDSTELEEYVNEMEKRLDLIMNPPDVNTAQRLLSNAGFIWYLSAPASAITNVLGGMIIGMPTLVGQYMRMYPGIPYTKAVATVMLQIGKSLGQIMSTGFGVDIENKSIIYPSMDRNANLSKAERVAYDRFVADGLIDITAAYDQAGLAGGPTETYSGAGRKAMERLASLFHNAERFNREIMAMSSFRAALAARKDYLDQDQAIAEAIAEAKDLTHRAMFDYSSPNKPRYFQNPTARLVTQFKQFPQQMTFFLARSAQQMWTGETEEVRREARARFVGTMGMAGIFSGVTGLWGFSTVANIINAVVNGMADDDDEIEPFDFELEFANWAAETFGNNIGTLLTRGVGNAMGVDIASRVKLDDMWFRDGRKNMDEEEALKSWIIELLGPTVGLAVSASTATKLWNEGHGDRALETIMPALAKQPLIAYRYSQEGAKTLQGETMLEELSPFELAMQSIGLRPAQLAEMQFYNITVKGQEQEILKKRQNLMNLYGLAFMANDDEALDTALEKIDRFNNNYPTVNIPMKSLNKSVRERLEKSGQTEHGLYLDKKLRTVLDKYSYARE